MNDWGGEAIRETVQRQRCIINLSGLNLNGVSFRFIPEIFKKPIFTNPGMGLSLIPE